MDRNIKAWENAKAIIPGGVNSPVRSFNSVGGTPFFTAKAHGCYLFDLENKCYIDYVCSWGANIVGHANPYVVDKVTETMLNGLSFGTPTVLETKLAAKVIAMVPAIEMVRLVNSGTEAVMSAIRLSRGFTKRDNIIKFIGGYHGHSDSLLVSSGSGVATFSQGGHPSSSGVTPAAVANTILLAYNDLDAIEQVFKEKGHTIASVIIEPFAGNMNFIRPTLEFIQTLRQLCTAYGAILIFDEVMTGFRVARGGSTELLGVSPDLITMGKIVGGGMPLALFGGKREIMQHLAPLGEVYQAGTLSGNPVAVAAGLATLELIDNDKFYPNISAKTTYLTEGLRSLAATYNLDFVTDSVGGMFGFYFGNKLPTNFEEMLQLDKTRFNQFFHAMLDLGIYFPPSMFEAGFVCSSHGTFALDETLNMAADVFKVLKKNK